MTTKLFTNEIIEAAILGYEMKIEGLREILRSQQSTQTLPSAVADEEIDGKEKRTMNVAARKRITAAQKARWAEYHKKKEIAANASPEKPKRKLSAAHRAAMAAGQQRRYAALRAEQKAAKKGKAASATG